MRHFKLILAYDGTAFHGWQFQPGLRTVQGVLEVVLEQVLEKETTTTAAGRTDAGVHARGQVVTLAADTKLPARALAPLLNRQLPEDVRVREGVEVGPGFDARRTACARRYAYHLLREDDVLWRRFAWHPRRAIVPEALERATRVLQGRHDFSAFQTRGSSPTHPVCDVRRAGWTTWPFGLRMDIIADHFLYRMVRNIVGTVLAAAESADPASTMRAVLESRSRGRAGVTAPPCGLTLEEVFYPAEAM